MENYLLSEKVKLHRMAPITQMPSSPSQLDPILEIRRFNKFAQDAINRFQSNQECIKLREADTQDILHEIELSGRKNARDGYLLYVKLKEVREDRRRAKDENEVLEPLVQWLEANKQVNSQLAQVQGKCSTKVEIQSKRRYTPRGNAARGKL